MRKRYNFTEAQLSEMGAAREAGQTCGQIALNYGCSAGYVYYLCLKIGADHPKGGVKASRQPDLVMRGGRPVRRFTEADDAALLKMAEEGVTHAEISRRLGRLNSSIRNRLLILAMHQQRREASAA